MFSIYDLIKDPPPMHIIDVGAMWLGEADVLYRNLLGRPGSRVIGFEPIGPECDKLNAMAGPDQVFLPYAIGDGTERTFYITNSAMTSSLYEPNTELLRHFPAIEALTRVVKRMPIRTHRLDDVTEVTTCHYLKLDVQGAELDVLRGSVRLLDQTAVIQCEVEFLPMYKGQPLFAEVDAFLRARGFLLHRLSQPSASFVHPFKPSAQAQGNPKLGTQTMWADAIYIPDMTRLHTLDPDRLLRAAMILHEVLRHPDMAALMFLHHDRLTGSSIWPEYLRRVTGRAPTPEMAV